MRREIERILMRRDGIDAVEAERLLDGCQNEINEIIDSGGTLEEIEDAIQDWLGLEPDYIFAFI